MKRKCLTSIMIAIVVMFSLIIPGDAKPQKATPNVANKEKKSKMDKLDKKLDLKEFFKTSTIETVDSWAEYWEREEKNAEIIQALIEENGYKIK